MRGRNGYNFTLYGCFTGYIVQAVVNNFLPLLFLMFHEGFQIPLGKITMLVSMNSALQLLVDLLALKFVDKIGYRVSIVSAHVFAALGLAGLTVLPNVFSDPFVGILLSVIIYAVGGGLLEVLISPIVEFSPTDNKEKAMSLLHSFYCWGHVCVVLLSTLYFKVFDIENWKYMAALWMVIPIMNGVLFTKVPIPSVIQEGEKKMALSELFQKKTFWFFIMMMICAGASEQAVSQWASAFVEKGLGISKTAGDLAGPMTFAVLMGIARATYGKYGHKIDLDSFIKGSTILCIFSYLGISFISIPIFGLISFALCGFSVGIFWPGTFSKASAKIKNGGTAMFALLALAGDLGCSAGPFLVGMISTHFQNNLKTGILSAVIFPLILLICILKTKRE